MREQEKGYAGQTTLPLTMAEQDTPWPWKIVNQCRKCGEDILVAAHSQCYQFQ
jgi:hypothetical protein